MLVHSLFVTAYTKFSAVWSLTEDQKLLEFWQEEHDCNQQLQQMTTLARNTDYTGLKKAILASNMLLK
jgi:hypothetical protein